MNILTDALPTSIDIYGKTYKLNTDFRNCLTVILACEDEGLTGAEKSQIILSRMYPSPPLDLREGLKAANVFLNGANPQHESDGTYSPRLYSFSKDANLIFAAFRQTHGIDLQTAELHWWIFLALFMDLGADTTFCNLVSLRKRIKSGTASKEEKRAAQEMGETFDIPDADNRTLDEKEKEAEFMRLVKGQ